jgi:hypothetical protein
MRFLLNSNLKISAEESAKIHFITGLERSGTTYCYNEKLNQVDYPVYFTKADNYLFAYPFLSRLTFRITSMLRSNNSFESVEGGFSESKGINQPSECVKFWKYLFQFGDDHNYKLADDTNQELSDFRLFVLKLVMKSKIKACGNYGIFIIKYPGLVYKYDLLKHNFPDAQFTFVFRDRDSNVKSLIRAKTKFKSLSWGAKFPKWKDYLGLSTYEYSIIMYDSVNNHLRQITERDETIEQYEFSK